MDIEKRLKMSFYKTIATINEEHKVYIVQNINDKHVYVKKILDVFNREIYEYLLANPIIGLPFIYDIYQEDNSLTVIEEYVSGNTLEELLLGNHQFHTLEVKKIAYQLCKILENLHNCNPPIIHRDIKPSNVILRNDGSIVLLDLNAAKHVNTDKFEDTTLLGTKGYAAPEQYGFGSSNLQTDIYALGMLMNTLLTGTFSSTCVQNNELTPIIEKCIQLNPKDRYKSIAIVKKFLEPDEQPSHNYPLNSWRKFLPPGFRTMNPFNILLASAGYIFLLWLCLSLNVQDATPTSLAIERFICLIIFLGIVFISSNYLDIHKKLPLCRSKNIFIKLLGIIISDISYMFTMFLFMVILITLIS